MYYYGYNSGYSYGSPNCGCGGQYNSYPQYGYGGYNNNNSGAIILVLFILLVIVIGARYVTN